MNKSANEQNQKQMVIADEKDMMDFPPKHKNQWLSGFSHKIHNIRSFSEKTSRPNFSFGNVTENCDRIKTHRVPANKFAIDNSNRNISPDNIEVSRKSKKFAELNQIRQKLYANFGYITKKKKRSEELQENLMAEIANFKEPNISDVDQMKLQSNLKKGEQFLLQKAKAYKKRAHINKFTKEILEHQDDEGETEKFYETRTKKLIQSCRSKSTSNNSCHELELSEFASNMVNFNNKIYGKKFISDSISWCKGLLELQEKNEPQIQSPFFRNSRRQTNHELRIRRSFHSMKNNSNHISRKQTFNSAKLQKINYV